MFATAIAPLAWQFATSSRASARNVARTAPLEFHFGRGFERC